MTPAPRRRRPVTARLLAVMGLFAASGPALAQQLDMTHGGPIDITAQDGIEWRQADQEVIARGDARAIRGNVTVTADRLTAWYRKKKATGPAITPASITPTSTTPPSAPGGLVGDPTTDDNEIYRLQADGHVHIFTQTDQAQGDKAVYDLDQSVMVMTGHDLKLTTPNQVITARDDLEYWPQQHMAVARGDAVVVTNDAKRVSADTLVAYTTENPPANGQAAPTPATASQTSADPLAASGKLQRIEAFGHVSIRTPTDTVTGERGVYVPDTGMARVAGNVQINRGQNQLNGAEADVNMKTGIAILIATNAGRVHGLVVPNDATNKGLANDPATGAANAAGAAKAAPAKGKSP